MFWDIYQINTAQTHITHFFVRQSAALACFGDNPGLCDRCGSV